MAEQKPYLMSEATFKESNTPYQVQTFAAKPTLTSKDEPPVCQNFRTYELAATRICELVRAPLCPLSGAHLAGIKLVKRVEPETLIDANINAVDEIPKAGIGVKDDLKPAHGDFKDSVTIE